MVASNRIAIYAEQGSVVSSPEKLQKNIFKSFFALCALFGWFNKPVKVTKNQATIECIMEIIISLQKIFVNAQDELNNNKKRSLKEKFLLEISKIEILLNSLKLQDVKEIAFCDSIVENIKMLNKQIIVDTAFDDLRVHKATEFIKKEGGVNPGYTIANTEGIRFTIKQGSTVGHTLSEVFSSMVLGAIVQAYDVADKSVTLIANAFLVVHESEGKNTCLTIENRCKTALYAASQWSKDRVSFDACQLFGLKKRKKAAGTRLGGDFEDLRELNLACDLGLETIAIPTALIVDFDLHTENFMLKINDQAVKDSYKEQVDFHLQLLKQEMIKTNYVTREARITYLIGIINTLKDLGAKVFFHKIDHDSGFYRYTDPVRKVDFLTHRTSPVHRVGTFIKTQPTLHITEITGGTKQGMDQLFLSDKGIDKLLKITLDVQSAIVSKTAEDFFSIVSEKSITIAGKDNTAAEFYLLNEFHYHIKEIRLPTPKEVSEVDISKIRIAILGHLELGTKLKVKDLHEQLYKRLLEKEKNTTLNMKQVELKSFLEEQEYLKDLIPGREGGVPRSRSLNSR